MAVCNVGNMDIKGGSNHVLYGRWHQMINRCYNEKHRQYKDYGGSGCYVCKDWLTFSNYINDIQSKENYEKLISNPKHWQIDKDILVPGNKCYSNDTTIITTSFENKKDNFNRNGNPNPDKCVLQYDLNGNFIKEYKSISEAARQMNIDKSGISACCLGQYKQMKGFKWSFKNK